MPAPFPASSFISPSHRAPLSFREKRFGLVALFFLALALLLPPLVPPQDYHDFVDTRTLLGIPRALDVLSNLGFLAAGGLGLLALALRRTSLHPSLTASLATFFAGVLLTAFGSAYYHWAPDDARLLWDRLPMALAFSGVFGCLGCSRVSGRAGWAALATALAYSLVSVWLWSSTGNLSFYALMQFGGLTWIAVAWIGGEKRPLDFPWGSLLGFCLAAKFFETFDAQTLAWTSGLFSGHSVKHFLVAMGAAAFARAVWHAGSNPRISYWASRR